MEKLFNAYMKTITILMNEYGLTYDEAIQLDLSVGVEMLENVYDDKGVNYDTPFEEVQKIKDMLNKGCLILVMVG
jgi:hypothetical protein